MTNIGALIITNKKSLANQDPTESYSVATKIQFEIS